MKAIIQVSLLVLGTLCSLSVHAEDHMAYGAAVELYRTLLVNQQCPKMQQGFNETKQLHPEQAFSLDSTYHGICQCQIARLEALQAKMSPAEKQEVVSGTDFQARLKTQVLEKCLGEMTRAMYSEQSCAQNLNKDLRKGTGYCHCISGKMAALSDAEAMELGLASSDYIPQMAEAKNKGLPAPAPPPSFKKFMEADKVCSKP